MPRFPRLGLLFIAGLGLVSAGCDSGGSSGGAVATDPVSASAGFVEVAESAGFAYEHGYLFIFNDLILMAAGVAAGDYDNDGWPDLYVIRGDVGPNLLFHNDGDGTFTEVGAEAGVDIYFNRGSGATFADWTGDGWLDLFIGGVDGTLPRLYVNNQDGTFTNVTSSSGVELDADWGTFSANFGDYDRDGDLDLFMGHWGANYADGSTPQHLWRNEGDGTFSHVPLPEVLESELDYTFTGNFSDVDGDGWLDLLIAGDFRTSRVLRNVNGVFEDATDGAVITDENGMGAAIADYDHDGDLDWFVSAIYSETLQPQGLWGTSGNRLYRNLGDGTFEDATDEAGVRNGGWGWGSVFADFDNDGNPDLLHVNGFEFPHIPDTHIVDEYLEDSTRLFMSNGDGTFTDRAAELGLVDQGQGRGVIAWDYDRDGDVDVFIANRGQAPKLFRNDLGGDHHFLNVRLEGRAPNRFAVGARVSVVTGDRRQLQELRCGNNYLSANPTELHFGLGDAESVTSVEVRWPWGEQTILHDVPADQFLVITPES